MAISVVSALVSSRLDQVNSVFYGAASKHINRLQRVQNVLARVVTYQRSYTYPLSSTALLQNLHWLLIEWRVHFKLATLAYKALHTGQPPNLSELLHIMNPHGLCGLPLLFSSLFHDTTLNLARVHFESQHQKSGIYCLLVSVILHHSLHFIGI